MSSHRSLRRSRRSWWWRYPLAALMVGFALLPVLWVISASLNPSNSLVGASLIPNNPGFVNYDDLINHPSFPYETWLWNSIKITVISVTLTAAITTLPATPCRGSRFVGKRAFMNGILILNVFPAVLSIIALFGMMQQIGTQIPWFGLDSHWGLIAIYVSFGMGINVLLVKRYIDRIPIELDESARVDGASHGRVFRSIVLPLIVPIIVTVAVLQFFADLRRLRDRQGVAAQHRQPHRDGRPAAVPDAALRTGLGHHHRRRRARHTPGRDHLHPGPEVRDQRSHVRRRQGLIAGRVRVRAGRRRSGAIPAHGSGRPYNRQP